MSDVRSTRCMAALPPPARARFVHPSSNLGKLCTHFKIGSPNRRVAPRRLFAFSMSSSRNWRWRGCCTVHAACKFVVGGLWGGGAAAVATDESLGTRRSTTLPTSGRTIRRYDDTITIIYTYRTKIFVLSAHFPLSSDHYCLHCLPTYLPSRFKTTRGRDAEFATVPR